MAPPTTTLILVCAHAIPLPGSTHGHSESEWLLEPFQQGETGTYLRHIGMGVDLLREIYAMGGQSERGVLVFSGGATKPKRLEGLGFRGRERTEGRGYWEIARHMLETTDGDSEKINAALLQRHLFHEDHATDSYQNILLSLLQYPIWLDQLQIHQRSSQPPGKGTKLSLPEKLIIISHEFKRARFMDLHLPAIRSLLSTDLRDRFDEMEVEFVGIDPPFTPEKMAEVEEGDRKRGYGVWKDDLFGMGEVLKAKRRERGWEEDGFLEDMRGRELDVEGVEQVKRLIRGKKWEER